MRTSTNHVRATVLAKLTAVAACLILSLTEIGQAQTIITNYLNFSDFAGSQAVALDTQSPTGMPTGITATWGWQFFLMNDFGAFLPPSGSSEGIDCRAGSVITFSSPVVIWSLAAVRLQWGQTLRLVGKLAGATVWVFDNPGTQYTWQAITVGAYHPIDSLEFACEDWNTRYTDIYLSDATGVPPPQQAPFITFFASTPPSPQFLAPNSPVQLTWLTRPGATLTIDQGIGGVTSLTDGNGNGLYQSVNPLTNTTYTLTSQDGTNIATAQITLNVNLPAGVGLLTFEDLPSVETALASDYRWNAPDGLNINWTGWAQKPGSMGTPSTPMIVYPTGNVLLPDGTNIASIEFTAADGTTARPIMVNSFTINNDPRMPGWGAGYPYVEARLGGVVQWTVTTNDLVDWINFVTKGAGIPVDELVFQAKWYQYDNFAITTTDAPLPPITLSSPMVQGDQFQFSWTSANSPAYLVFAKDTLANGWTTSSGLLFTNTYSVTTNIQDFYRVMRFP